MANKGLKRLLVVIVFCIPVGWYLILQVFGSNKFSLQAKENIPASCEQFHEITIVAKDDSLSTIATNYMNRVIFAANKQKAILEYRSPFFFDCINQSAADLVLVNVEGLWGAYALDREGVDLLLTELDVLKLQKSYGQGTSR